MFKSYQRSGPSCQTPTAFIARREDSLFIGPPGSCKSHLAQAIGQAAIQQGYRVLYRETHTLLEELAEGSLDGTRKQHMESLVLGMYGTYCHADLAAFPGGVRAI